MCKVVMFTNFRKMENKKQVSEYLGNELLKTEKDGFGFAVQGEKGAYGEKFLGKNQSFETNLFYKNPSMYSLKGAPFINNVRKSFGDKSKASGGALFHGRTSTNKLGFKNTHPILKHGWTLIHNGVVTDHGPKYKMITDNDTEHLVERMATGGIESLTKHLTGYYAFGAFDPLGNLHIAKDKIAWLYVAKLPEYDTYMFATTESLISDFCENFQIKKSAIELVKDDVYFVFSKEGKLITCQEIKSRGYDTYSKSLAHKSLGYQNEYSGYTNSGYEDWKERNYGSAYDELTGEVLTGENERTGNNIEQLIQDQINGSDDDRFTVTGDERYTAEDASYDKYRAEIELHLDDQYTIYDFGNRLISLPEFKSLDCDDQDACTIVRPDGTWLTFLDYEQDKFPKNVNQ